MGLTKKNKKKQTHTERFWDCEMIMSTSQMGKRIIQNWVVGMAGIEA